MVMIDIDIEVKCANCGRYLEETSSWSNSNIIVKPCHCTSKPNRIGLDLLENLADRAHDLILALEPVTVPGATNEIFQLKYHVDKARAHIKEAKG